MARYSLGLLEIIDHCSTANTGPKSPGLALITGHYSQLIITDIIIHLSVLRLRLLHVLLLATCHVSGTRAGLRDEVKARAGTGVTLRCAVNKARCGDFHSIKWYKENRRVYVYSPVVDFSKVGDKLYKSAE